jgi:hypothetical protein
MMKTILLLAALILSVGAAQAKPISVGALDRYAEIQRALAEDSLARATKAAVALTQALTDPALRKSAEKIAKAKSLEEARAGFKEVSTPLVAELKKNKKPGYELYTCPMVKADWIQKGGTVANPYAGKAMASCGEAIE